MLTRPAIKALMRAGLIEVTPDPVKIGPNSIDLRLGDELKMYHPTEGRVPVKDPLNGGLYHAINPKSPPPLIDVPKVREVGHEWPHPSRWDNEGFENHWLLVPGQFYLARTLEETYCRGVIPHLDGRSTCGRLSIEAHKTAGVGDNGFRGRWTLEIEVTEPVLIAPGDRLFQIYFTPAWGAGLAHFIHSRVNPFYMARLCKEDPAYVEAGGVLPDGEPRYYDRWLEADDLYGAEDGGHHYQGSKKVKGAEPLD